MQDDGAVVGGILDGLGFSVQAHAVFSGEYLANHNLHARILRAVSSGNAADSVSVVHGGNRTGYVRAVTDVAYIRPRNGCGIVYEVISVSVVLVSVAVGIRSGIEFLFVVYPYIACQVGMCIHHSVVQYGNDNGRVARAFLPCFVAADIASGY